MAPDTYFSSQTAHTLERERLTCIEEGLDPISTRHLEALGVGPGWTCLEVGGGGGSIARWLADKVGPSGRVVAIDKDLRFLREINRPNLELRQADILGDTLEAHLYDLAHCRLLLTHLPEHERAVQRMIAALKIAAGC
jgi:ubiquinone/menaquinone biosynthesis C-methylase UbiE